MRGPGRSSRLGDHLTSQALPSGTSFRAIAATFADAAAFSIVASATIAIPVIFSIALPDVFALPKTILAVALGGLLIGLLAVRWIAMGLPLRRCRSFLAAALVAFVGWNLLATWFAIDRTQAVVGEQLQYQGLATILAYVIFLLAAWTTVRGARRQTLFLLCVTAGAVVVAGYALIQRAGLDPIWPTLPHDRVFSTIGQANALAAYLVMAVPLILGLAAGQRWPVQVVGASIVVVALTATAFTLSRGGYLGIAAASIVLILAVWGTRKRLISRRRLGVAALVGLIGLVVALSVPEARAAVQRVVTRALLTADLSEGSIRNHLDLWTVGVAIAADHPLMGTGRDTYVLLFGTYRDQVLSPERASVMSVFRPESPHNVYLAEASGAGLPALAAYITVVGAVVGRILSVVRSIADPRVWLIGIGLLAAIVGHLVTDAFMTAETAGSVLFWTVLGMGAALTWSSPSSAAQSRTQNPRAAEVR